MPRFEKLMDAAGNVTRRQFTDAEETQRDEEITAERTRLAARNTNIARHAVLQAKITDDSITFDELKEFTRLDRGL